MRFVGPKTLESYRFRARLTVRSNLAGSELNREIKLALIRLKAIRDQA